MLVVLFIFSGTGNEPWFQKFDQSLCGLDGFAAKSFS
jgi:hypothetical protein